MVDDAVIEARGLTKSHGSGAAMVEALKGVDLAVGPGRFLAVAGRSGSGKTTLLNLLGGLEVPSSGSVLLDGNVVSDLSEDGRAEVRRDNVGFVFQGFGLLPMLTAAENVEVPLRMVGVDPAARSARSAELLEMVGLDHRAGHRPDELSGGEQQRVAIARALANRPRLLLADEPTGQLDTRTGAAIVAVLSDVVRTQGVAAVVVTHDTAPLAVADEVAHLSDGRFVAS